MSTYQCRIETRAAQPVLSVRLRMPVTGLPQALGQWYGAIAHYLGELGEQPAGAPFAAYYNMDMEDLDVEIGMPVPRMLPGKAQIAPGQIPGGPVGIALHVGPYGAIAPAYDALTDYVQEHGYQPTGVAYEFYTNDPGTTPQEELETLLLFPLEAD